MTSGMKMLRHAKYRKAKGWKPLRMTMAEYNQAQGLSMGSKKAWKKKKRAHRLERIRRARLKR